jgi:uncharacterized protein (TIGR03089 family)
VLTALAHLVGGSVPGDAAAPFLTFYDDATGERTELSYATTDNWVAKTANFLRDGLGVLPGDTVRVDLPPHWQTVVVTFAVWAVGASVGDGDVVFAAAPVPAREVVLLSLKPMAGRLDAVPPGAYDFADEVPAYGDRFTATAPATAPPGEPDARRLLLADADPVPYALAALRGGGSLVICRHADAALLARRAETERAQPAP